MASENCPCGCGRAAQYLMTGEVYLGAVCAECGVAHMTAYWGSAKGFICDDCKWAWAASVGAVEAARLMGLRPEDVTKRLGLARARAALEGT